MKTTVTSLKLLTFLLLMAVLALAIAKPKKAKIPRYSPYKIEVDANIPVLSATSSISKIEKEIFLHISDEQNEVTPILKDSLLSVNNVLQFLNLLVSYKPVAFKLSQHNTLKILNERKKELEFTVFKDGNRGILLHRQKPIVALPLKVINDFKEFNLFLKIALRSKGQAILPISINSEEKTIKINHDKKFIQEIIFLFGPDASTINSENSIIVTPSLLTAATERNTTSTSSSSSSSSSSILASRLGNNSANSSVTSLNNSGGKSSIFSSASSKLGSNTSSSAGTTSSASSVPSSNYSRSRSSSTSSTYSSSIIPTPTVTPTIRPTPQVCCEMCIKRKIEVEPEAGLFSGLVDVFESNFDEKHLEEPEADLDKCCTQSIQQARFDAGHDLRLSCDKLPDIVAKTKCIIKETGLCCTNTSPETPTIPERCRDNLFVGHAGHGDSDYANQVCMPLLMSICTKNDTSVNFDGSYTCSLASNPDEIKQKLREMKQKGCKIRARLNIFATGPDEKTCAQDQASPQLFFDTYECKAELQCPPGPNCLAHEVGTDCIQCKDPETGESKKVKCHITNTELSSGIWQSC